MPVSKKMKDNAINAAVILTLLLAGIGCVKVVQDVSSLLSDHEPKAVLEAIQYQSEDLNVVCIRDKEMKMLSCMPRGMMDMFPTLPMIKEPFASGKIKNPEKTTGQKSSPKSQ